MGGNKSSVTGVSPKWMKSRRWRRKKKKEGENNGQLCFVRHHKWRTQARLDQLIVLMAVACTYTIYRFLFEETERDIAFEFWF